MPKIRIDFTGVKPWKGDFQMNIPRGDYSYAIEEAEVTTSRNGNAMVQVELRLEGHGQTNARLRDYFVLESSFDVHLCRLASLFASAGVIRENPSLVGIELEIDRLIGRGGVCKVADKTMEATEKFPEKLVSAVSLYRLPTDDGFTLD